MTKVAKLLILVVCGTMILQALPQAFAIEGTPITVGIDVGVMGTDNRDYAAENQEESTTDIFASPNLQFLMDWESAMLELYYAPKYRYRSDPNPVQGDTEWYHEAKVRAEVKPSDRLTVRVQDKFYYTDDPAIAISEQPVSPQSAGGTQTPTDLSRNQSQDYSYWINDVTGLASLKVAPSFALSVDASHRVRRYKDDLVARQSDSDQLSVGLNAKQALGKTLTVVGRVASQNYNLKDLILTDTTTGSETRLPRGFDAIQAGLGLEKFFSTVVYLTAMAGVQVADYDDPLIDDDTYPYFSALLSADLTPTVNLQAQASHMLVNAYTYPFSSQRHTSFYGKLTWDVVAILTLGASLEYRIEDYEADAVNPNVPDSAYPKDKSGEEDTLYGVVSATVNFTPTTSLELAYSREDVDSDVFTTFVRNTGTVTFSKDF